MYPHALPNHVKPLPPVKPADLKKHVFHMFQVVDNVTDMIPFEGMEAATDTLSDAAKLKSDDIFAEHKSRIYANSLLTRLKLMMPFCFVYETSQLSDDLFCLFASWPVSNFHADKTSEKHKIFYYPDAFLEMVGRLFQKSQGTASKARRA